MIDQGNSNVYSNELKFGNGMNQMNTGAFPMYVPAGMMETVTPADPISRKRSRDSCSFDPSVLPFPNGEFVNQIQTNDRKGMFTFLGEDFSMQIYQQQLEIDQFIAHHNLKMISEIEANRRITSMRLISLADEGMKRLRSKDNEIVQIGKLNRALEDKVKSLILDNQIYQQMAQTNEATANVLRRNLQQILTQIQQQKQQCNFDGKLTGDEAESCCGSNGGEGEEGCNRRMLERGRKRNDNSNNNNGGGRWWCRKCGKEEEFGVLLLPCRHLCVCTECESSINVCPICKCYKNASLHVNMI